MKNKEYIRTERYQTFPRHEYVDYLKIDFKTLEAEKLYEFCGELNTDIIIKVSEVLQFNTIGLLHRAIPTTPHNTKIIIDFGLNFILKVVNEEYLLKYKDGSICVVDEETFQDYKKQRLIFPKQLVNRIPGIYNIDEDLIFQEAYRTDNKDGLMITIHFTKEEK